MFEIDGKEYYFDFERLIEQCRVMDFATSLEKEGLSINVFKYDLLKMCVERVMDDFTDSETREDVFSKDEMLNSYKLSFNTLLKEGIISEDE